MTTDERLRKAIRRTESAILHVTAIEATQDVDQIIGHLKRALDGLHALNYKTHHDGREIIQTALWEETA